MKVLASMSLSWSQLPNKIWWLTVLCTYLSDVYWTCTNTIWDCVCVHCTVVVHHFQLCNVEEPLQIRKELFMETSRKILNGYAYMCFYVNYWKIFLNGSEMWYWFHFVVKKSESFYAKLKSTKNVNHNH